MLDNLSLKSNKISKLFLFSLTCLILYQLIGISNVSGNVYVSYQMANNNTATITTPTMAFSNIPDADINLGLTAYADFTSSAPFSATQSYYSPFNSLIATATITGNGNFTCRNMGTKELSNIDNENVESRIILTSSADDFKTFLVTNLTVNTNEHDIIISNDENNDSMGRIKNYYYFKDTGTTLSSSWSQSDLEPLINSTIATFNANFTTCTDNLFQSAVRDENDYGVLSIFGRQLYTMRLIVLNSSHGGVINYSINTSGFGLGSYGSCTSLITGELFEAGYFKLGSGQTVLSTTINTTGTLNLEENSIYVFYVAGLGWLYRNAGANCYNPFINEPNYFTDYTIKIDTPNWDCGDWTDCESGLRTRLCVDANGYYADRIESEACYDFPYESINFGFENYTSESVWYNYIGFLCACYPEIKTVLYPENWYISNTKFKIINQENKTGRLYDLIKMTNEDAYESDKSLKMWNIPPQLRIPDVSGFNSIENFYYSNSTADSFSDNRTIYVPENAYTDDGTDAAIYSDGQILYHGFGFDMESNDEISNLSLRIDAWKMTNTSTVQFNCIKIRIGDEWSDCQELNPLTVYPNATQTYVLDFTEFAMGYHASFMDNLSLNITTNVTGVTGFLGIDFVELMLTGYNADDLVHVYDDMLCGNQSTGVYPEIHRDVSTDENTSVFVERNITLPTPYMSVSFKVKKCHEPEIKYYSVPLCLDFDDNCYTHSESCNDNVDGKITFYLRDAITGEFLYDLTSDVIFPNKWEIKEYSIDSLQPNKVYTIGFAVVPESTVDPNYYCVYLDDVNIDIRTQPLVCTSECDDDNNEIFRECKNYDAQGNCLVCDEIEITNSPNCIASSSVITKIEGCLDWCGCEEFDATHSKYHTKFVGNLLEGCNETLEGIGNCCEFEEIAESSYCLEYCESQRLTEGTDDIDVLRETLGAFFSPIFIITYIILGIGAVFAFFLKQWQVFAIAVIIGFLVAGTVWIEMAFISLLIIVVIAYFLAKEHSGGNQQR